MSDELATRRFVASLLGPEQGDPTGVDWNLAVEFLRLHALAGLAVSLDEASGGKLLPESVRAELEPQYRMMGLITSLMMETAEKAREALGGADVPHLLFKGAALVADGSYPDGGGRTMDDVDVLVPSDRADEAWSALQACGFEPWRPWIPEATPLWLDSATFTDPASPSGIDLVVDLHWRTEYGGLRFGDPAGGSVLWKGADLDTAQPAPESHLILLGEHLLKHLRFQTHLPAYSDLARVAARVRAWDEVVEASRGRRLGRAFGLLLDVCREELGHPVPAEVAGELAGRTLRDETLRDLLRPRTLLGRTSPAEGRLQGLALRWRLLGSLRAVAADIRAATFPSRGWLRARYGTGKGEGTLGLWLRYAKDLGLWATGAGSSPASPNQ